MRSTKARPAGRATVWERISGGAKPPRARSVGEPVRDRVRQDKDRLQACQDAEQPQQGLGGTEVEIAVGMHRQRGADGAGGQDGFDQRSDQDQSRLAGCSGQGACVAT